MNRRILFRCAVLLAAHASAFAQSGFDRVTNTPISAILTQGTGVTWFSSERYARPDILQGNFSGANRFFRNDLSFTNDVKSGLTISGPQTYGVSVADYDNDGRPDVFFANGYGIATANTLFHNEGDGVFKRVDPWPRSGGARSSGCAWADYDRDGLVDLFVANSGSVSELWKNKGNGNFERVSSAKIPWNVADSVGAAWGDYAHDGWPDLFVANGFGSGPQKNFLYHNNRDGTFSRVETGSIGTATGYFCGVAWADYDNDGWLDVFVTNARGRNGLFRNNGNGTFDQVLSDEIATDSGEFISAAWADYDNDGWLDLFVGNRADGAANKLYHNNRDGTFTAEARGPITEDVAPNGGCAWGDFDGDGYADLFVSVLGHTEGTKSLLYRNRGGSNQFFKILLRARTSNGSAIGAKVRLTSTIGGKAVTQLREVNTGDGLAGNSQELVFGLGAATNVTSLVVEWPSGQVTRSPANLQLRVHEIWEPEPVTLAVSSLVRSSNTEVQAVRIVFAGGDPTIYAGPLLPDTDISAQRHGYEFEASHDLVHWIKIEDISPIFAPSFSDRTEVLLNASSSEVNSKKEWFVRVHDLGFVPWFI